YAIGSASPVYSRGKTHRSGVSTGTCPIPPKRGDSLVQRVSHLQPDGGASKGSAAGCKTCICPKFTSNKRSSVSAEKYLRTKLFGPRTAPSTPSQGCRRKRESFRRSLRRSMCRL